MANLKTSQQKTYNVRFASASDYDGRCVIYMDSTRLFSELAPEFENLEWLDYENEAEGASYHWEGFNKLILLSADSRGGIQIQLEKET